MALKLPKEAKADLAEVLDEVYLEGRAQVAKEISLAIGTAEVAGTEVPSAVSSLADVVLAGIANDATSRVASVAARAVTVGLTGTQLRDRIEKDVGDLSDAPVNRASIGAANRGLGMGRRDEGKAQDPKGVWVWSAILDTNCCSPCFEQEGEEYTTLADAPETPYEDCLGMDLCRCFLVLVAEDEQ